MSDTTATTGRTVLPFVAPFAAYMAFIALEGGLATLAEWLPALAPLAEGDHLWLYPAKLLVPLALLWWFRAHYAGLNWRPNAGQFGWGVATGVVVFLLWIQMDWSWATQGDGGEGYNPHDSGLSAVGVWSLIAVRLAGASLVVPLFEELFWRAFLMRYLVDTNFSRVRLGHVTPLAFIATCVLFGLEHHLWLAGMMAGVAYATLLWRTASMGAVVLAHGTTNLLLGLWVIQGGHWQFW